MRKIYASKTVLEYFESANKNISDKLKFVLAYIFGKKNPFVSRKSIG